MENYGTMVSHWKMHLKLRVFQCDLCEKMYSRKCNLTEHIQRDHIREQRFKCLICEFSATSARRLRTHKKLKHGGKLEKMLRRQKLKSSRSKGQHAKRVHSSKRGAISVLIACPNCRVLVRRSALRYHLSKQHENLRYCDQCDKAFSFHDLKM